LRGSSTYRRGTRIRMFAAHVVLYVGFGIVIAVALYRRLVLGER
jgi:hypothetical protein